jgi:DNA-binding response OmpR family regulator
VLDRWRKGRDQGPGRVLTARDSWSDKVAGPMPAPTIISLPFQIEELIAPARADLLRPAMPVLSLPPAWSASTHARER